MRSHSLAATLFLALAATTASAQPPPETNAYRVIDVGPIAVGACRCVAAPFTIPQGRPGWGYGSGPAAPADDAPPSKTDRTRTAQERAQERANLPALTEDARAGNPHASITVAHYLAQGTDRERAQAVDWFLLAAQQGHPDAPLALGYRYRHGLFVKQNDRAAAYWFHAGALHGNRVAMVALAMMYAAGRGLPQDWESAVAWLLRAGEGGTFPLASRFLGDAYACGLGVPPSFGSALAAYEAGAKAGDLGSMVQLARLHESGCGPVDETAAFEAYRKAAEQGEPEAQVAISEMYLQARGTGHAPNMAYFWARLADRRLEPGSLRDLAAARAALAARWLTAAQLEGEERVISALIAENTRPMSK
jgi:TPR repeat protein